MKEKEKKTNSLKEKIRNLTLEQIWMGIAAVLLIWAVTATTILVVKSSKFDSAREEYDTVRSERDELSQRVSELEDQAIILGDTVNRKVEQEEIREAQEAALFTPSGIPVTGSTVSFEEKLDDEELPYIVFSADKESQVVCAGSGMVLAVTEEEDGNQIVIEHGNGYQTVYRAKENPQVNEGQEITKGTVLFVVTRNSRKITYRVMDTESGKYIDPLVLMEIYG